jgi:hypothetical protein
MRGLHRSPTDPRPPAEQLRDGVRHRRLARLGQATAALLVSGWMLLVLSGGAFAVSASPVAPPGAEGLQDLLNWTLYGGAIACAGTSMYGFAKMGISHTQQSFQGANHGKSVAILGLLGALGLGLTPTIVNGLTAIH